NRKAKIRRQSPGNRAPGMAVVVAAQHPNIRALTARAGPVGPSAVVLHVEAAGRILMADYFVNALAKLGIRIRREARPYSPIRRLKRFAAVLTEVVSPGGNADVQAFAVANDRVHAESPTARVPFARVLVVADAGHHFPRISPVPAAKQRRRLHATQQFLLRGARLDRPDVDQRAPIVPGKCRGRFGFFEAFAKIGGAQQLHSEKRITGRSENGWRAARVRQGGVNGNARPERSAQRETLPRFRGFGNENAFPGTDRQYDSFRHTLSP